MLFEPQIVDLNSRPRDYMKQPNQSGYEVLAILRYGLPTFHYFHICPTLV